MVNGLEDNLQFFFFTHSLFLYLSDCMGTWQFAPLTLLLSLSKQLERSLSISFSFFLFLTASLPCMWVYSTLNSTTFPWSLVRKLALIKSLINTAHCSLPTSFQIYPASFRVADPATFIRSGCSGRIRVFWSDPGVLVRSGCSCRIRVFWSDPSVLVGSGCSGRIRIRLSSWVADSFFGQVESGPKNSVIFVEVGSRYGHSPPGSGSRYGLFSPRIRNP